jgi:hypothetical protein
LIVEFKEVIAGLGFSSALLHIGIPDRPIPYGSRGDCLVDAGLDFDALRAQIKAWWRHAGLQTAQARAKSGRIV